MSVALLAGVLILAEGVLQALSWAIWATHHRTPARNTTESDIGSRVLCLGDSYTFGMGASSPGSSYPAQLEAMLNRRADTPWTVVNAGWPSRNSRELLELLPAAMATHTPKAVCIIIGINDAWSQPQRLTLPERTFTVTPPEGSFPWRVRTLRLLRLLLAGSPAEAAENPDRRVALIQQSLAVGDTKTASQHLQWLRALHEQHPGRWHTEAYVSGLVASGREDEALELARSAVSTYPDSHRLWLTLAKQSARIGDMEAARRAIDKAVEIAHRAAEPNPFLWRTRAAIYRDTNPRIVAESLIRAWLIDQDSAQARQWFQVYRHLLSNDLISEGCTEVRLTNSQRQTVEALFTEGAGGAGSLQVETTLAHHLRQVVTIVRNSGARPLLGSYPFAGAFGHESTRSVAQELSVEYVDVLHAFRKAKETEPGLQLFVHDGHCNDRGYALMARTFADALMAKPNQAVDP